MLLSLTQRNAVDLHSLGTISITLATAVDGRRQNSATITVRGSFFYNKSEVKFMKSCNHTEVYRK